MGGTRRVTVARIGAPHGVRGWMRVHSFTTPPENVFGYQPWHLQVGSEWKVLRLREGRPHGKGLIASLEGVEDRDAARGLTGADVAVERATFGEADPGQYFWADLIGTRVENRGGAVLGEVDHLIDTGYQDVLVILGPKGEEILIPFVHDHFILDVDLARGCIRVDWEFDEE